MLLDQKGRAQWARKQLYINPTSFSIKESKLVRSDLTKGGYVVQYFGEQLQVIDVSGTTGSSGVEGINILRDIYRHEQHNTRKHTKQERTRTRK